MWGPYLAERERGTVREDCSQKRDAWGEDGIAGISDDKQRLCFALAFWKGRDPILKERMFGPTDERILQRGQWCRDRRKRLNRMDRSCGSPAGIEDLPHSGGSSQFRKPLRDAVQRARKAA